MIKKTSTPTVAVLTVALMVLYLLLGQIWLIFSGIFIGIIGIISERAALTIDLWWLRLAQLLNKITSTVILSLIFYVFLYPIALVSKLFVKDPLLLRNNLNSTFQPSAQMDIKENMEKPW